MSTMWREVVILTILALPVVIAVLGEVLEGVGDSRWLMRRRERKSCPICPHGTVLFIEDRRGWCRYHRERWYRIHSLEREALSDDGTLPWHAQTGLS